MGLLLIEATHLTTTHFLGFRGLGGVLDMRYQDLGLGLSL